VKTATHGFERPELATGPVADGRYVREDPRDLLRRRGFVAELRDGTWVQVGRSRRGHVQLLGRDGARWLRDTAAAELLTGRALEVLPSLRLGGTVGSAMGELLTGSGKQLARVLLTFVVAQGAVIMMPLLTRSALDTGIYGGNASVVQVLAVALAVSSVWYAGVMWWRNVVVQMCKSFVERVTNRALMRHMFDVPFARTDALTSGELLQVFFGAQVFRDLTVDRAMAALFDATTVLASLCAAALLVPSSLAVLVPAVALIGAIGFLSARLQVRLRRDELRQQAVHRGYLVELLQSVITVKVAVAEEPLMRRWLGALRHELAIALKRQRTALRFDLVTYACVHGSVVAVVCAVALLSLNQDGGIGTLVALTQVGTGVVTAAAAATSSVVAAAVSAPHLARTIELATTPVAGPVAQKMGLRNGGIVVRDVAFRHADEGPRILQNVSFTVPPGVKLRVSGPSGAGKSTLLRIVAGLYRPDSGEVIINGACGVTYIPQRAHIFAGTILQNLRRYSARAADDLLFAAAEQVGLDRWVRTLPLGYATPVGPGGVTVSGGQRQLIALAGAVAAEKSVILLDEPSSNLDSVTASAVFAAPAWRDRTVIFATHDERLFTDALEYRLPARTESGAWRP
jgi:ABC-type bacteriocin/lantibiotic exporter with double-glycine peptidase domain